jgi:hypothetical protein
VYVGSGVDLFNIKNFFILLLIITLSSIITISTIFFIFNLFLARLIIDSNLYDTLGHG